MNNRSLLGEYFFLLRLSCVLLSFGAEFWRTQSQGLEWPKHFCRKWGESTGTAWVEGCKGQKNLFSPMEMGPKHGVVPTPPCGPHGR